MSNFLNKIPVSPITSFGSPSIPNGSTIGTNFSILQTGGYMEVYDLSGLTYTVSTTGVIEFSGNSIPIQFTKGTGSIFSPDVLTLNSDNISSGRRKLGMLAYVYETKKIYQFRIDNYDTLWNNATGATGPGGPTVVISNFGTTVKNNSAAGIALINAWTASTISGIGGYDDTNASWRVLSTGGGTSVTGGTFNNNTDTLTLNNSTGGTITITGFTDYYTTGFTFNPASYDLTIKRNDGLPDLSVNLSILSSDVTITGGTYNSSTGTATFTNNTGGTFNITGFLTGFTDIYVTGGTFNNNNQTLTLTRTDNVNVNVSGFTDVFVTGGTYSGSTIIFTNNTGGTFNVTGITSGGGGFTGGTVSGATNFTGGLTANTISATTYQGLPITILNSNSLISTGLSGTGIGFTTIQNSNFFGVNSGYLATGATNSNFFGQNAGNAGTTPNGANNSNFIGNAAGQNARFSSNSNFFGQNAGGNATSSNNSNFLGLRAGQFATNSANSNFLGSDAGYAATTANNSNFFGQFAGENGSGANESNFFGSNAGKNATNASYANFIGSGAGTSSTGGQYSNFVGNSAGSSATNASQSNFFGRLTGYQAINASNSTLIGTYVGRADVLGSIGSNNIIIGTNISLPTATTNSINIGGVLFGTGTYSATTGNPSITAQTSGRIGINVLTPTEALDVLGNTRIRGSLTATTISATTYLNLPSSGGSFTGGTVSGGTIFTNGLTANTFSATTISATTYNGYTPANDDSVVKLTENQTINGLKTFQDVTTFYNPYRPLKGILISDTYVRFNNGGGGETYGDILCDNITDTRTYQLPNQNGTIALTSDISASDDIEYLLMSSFRSLYNY